MSTVTATLKLPNNKRKTLKGTADTQAHADAELKAVLKTQVGTVLGVSVSVAAASGDDASVVFVAPNTATAGWHDMTLGLTKVISTGVLSRELPMQDVDNANTTTQGVPDLAQFATVASTFYDADGITGFTAHTASWE